MCYDAFSDEELIAKLRRGENEVTDYILEKYKPLVRKRTNAMYLMGGETEDLIQEGMIGLLRQSVTIRKNGKQAFIILQSFASIASYILHFRHQTAKSISR